MPRCFLEPHGSCNPGILSRLKSSESDSHTRGDLAWGQLQKIGGTIADRRDVCPDGTVGRLEVKHRLMSFHRQGHQAAIVF